MQSEISSLYVL